MDSVPSGVAATHSRLSEKPSEYLHYSLDSHADLAHLVAGLTLGDGHVRHEVPVVSVPQGQRPLADYHLSWTKRLQD